LLVDRANPERIFAGVVNDKSYGGAFVSTNGGKLWEQVDKGLDGRDVFALAESPDGTILAGTNHGIFALEVDAEGRQADSWSPRNIIQNTLVKRATETHYGKRINVEKQVKDTVRTIEARVFALDVSSDVWLASTAGGLFTSQDKGASWQGGPVLDSVEYLSVAVHGTQLVAVRKDRVILSSDAGQTWMPIGVPTMLTRIHSAVFSADGTLWLGAREGVYFTRDLGKTWLWVHRLPLSDVDDLSYDAQMGKILVSSRSSDQVYIIDPKSLVWTWTQTGYRLNRVRAAGDRLLAASLYDGVLVEPKRAGVQAGER
jgi:photosystem II stability/assembly factor-like uncharacterized protein